MKLKSRFIILNNNEYKLSDIKAEKYDIKNKSPFEVATLKFCNEWLNSKETFTIKTSGSTGNPKIINLSSKQMKASAQMTLKALQLEENDTALVCLNTRYIAGIMMLTRGLVGKLQLVIQEPSSNPFLDISNFKIDFTAVVPLQLQTAIENKKSRAVIKNIRNIIIGGAPVSSTLEAVVESFDNKIFHTYGMTETVSHVALRRLSGDQKTNYYSPLDGIDIDTDQRGCLKLKGAVTNNQWIVTNDLVTLLNNSKFIWHGRIDNVINSGGIKFQIEELEKKIDQIFQKLNIIKRFFIVGKPNEFLGEEIVLIIEGDNNVEEKNALQVLIKESLKKFEAPKFIYFISSFKETPTGKIQKKDTLRLLDIF